MTLWLYLHFPALQLNALFAEQEHPLVIVDGARFQVVQANDLAIEQGIQIGMGLGSASALCHDLQVHPYDEKQEQQTLTDIAQWLYMVTSDIALFAPQGILLKASDMLCLYGSLERYWQTLSQHLDALGFKYYFSTGFSPYSAILLAKSATQIISDDRDHLLEKVRNFPLMATELASKQVDALLRVGVNTLNDLLSLPMQELARRFDIDLVNYVGRLLGQFKHPIDFYHPPEKFHSYLELLYEIENIQWLEKPLNILLKRLELFLTLRNQVAYELALTLHQRDKQDSTITFTSASGDYTAQQWARLCQLTLESIKLDAPVQGLTLAITRCGELEATSRDIFNGPQGQQTELELIGLLQAKLGKQQVRKVMLSDDPRPEHATQLCDPSKPIPYKAKTLRHRPSILLPEPQRLQEKVALIQGPERFVTGWWDGADITRDYFVARSQQGRWLWVFRNQDKQWFLHGQFC